MDDQRLSFPSLGIEEVEISIVIAARATLSGSLPKFPSSNGKKNQKEDFLNGEIFCRITFLVMKLIFPRHRAVTRELVTSPCSWHGVSCIEGSIIQLNLSMTGLKGTLYNFSFSSFSNLTYFELNVNELNGSIPPQIITLSKLKYLDLSANLFSGIIPLEIGHFNESRDTSFL
ncbi:hypothetical protein LguiB_018669 [Lonicera macranthoides]